MSTDEGQGPRHAAAAEAGIDAQGVEQLEREVARTREQLGGTVDALGTKLDVRSGLDQRVAAARDAVTDRDDRPLPAVWVAAAGSTLATIVGLVLWARARSTSRARRDGAARGSRRR